MELFELFITRRRQCWMTAGLERASEQPKQTISPRIHFWGRPRSALSRSLQGNVPGSFAGADERRFLMRAFDQVHLA